MKMNTEKMAVVYRVISKVFFGEVNKNNGNDFAVYRMSMADMVSFAKNIPVGLVNDVEAVVVKQFIEENK